MSTEATGEVELRSNATLAGLLDQLLATGVVLAGDVELGIADVPLAQVRLLAVLGSVDTLHRQRPGPKDGLTSSAYVGEPPRQGSDPSLAARTSASSTTRTSTSSAPDPDAPPELREAQRALTDFADGLAHEPEKVQQGLVQLVLSLVELLRQVMERQAVRRFEAGSLTDEQAERVGTTLMLLQQRMDELRDIFGLSEDDLALDLGPLGRTV